MPWHVAKSSSCPSSRPWAVIKDSDSSVVACHATKAGAQSQVNALYAQEASMDPICPDCEQDRDHFESRAVDNTGWDAGPPMAACTSADSPGSCFRAICAGRKAGPPEERNSWALPHHKSPGSPPNAAGTRSALSYFSRTQGLTNRDEARRHLEAHMASIQAQSASKRPPRDNLVRFDPRGYELRWDRAEDGEINSMPTMVGHFARFGEWTEIDSLFEGRFMEQVASGAFSKTFDENRDNIRSLFQHGRDPQIGDKVLGPVNELREDEQGAYYEVPLLDTSYNRDLLPGLEQGLYGASFRFRVMKEDVEQSPDRSEMNPDGIPQRTIREAQVMEFGPVTFPAYAGATAGVRSMTDEFDFFDFTSDPGRLRDVIEYTRQTQDLDKPERIVVSSQTGAATSSTPVTITTNTNAGAVADTPAEVREEEDLGSVDLTEFTTVEALEQRHGQIGARLAEIDTEHGVQRMSTDTKAEWDGLVDERDEIESTLEELRHRQRDRNSGAKIAVDKGNTEPGDGGSRASRWDFQTDRGTGRVPEDIYDVGAYRMAARDHEDQLDLLRQGAMRSVESSTFFTGRQEDLQAHVERLLKTIDEPDIERGKFGGELARRILNTGSPLYQRAFNKYLRHGGLVGALSPEEQRALAVGAGATGGFAVVYTLDPTIVPTSNYSVNPFRAISRVETISGTNEWKAVTSGAITASYVAESTEATDNAPTLAQPDIIVERAQAYVPFSIEVGQDWGGLQTEMGRLFQDAKDDLEATKFTLGAGHGSTEPKGIITAATNTTAAGGVAAFAVADLYKVFEALPPRYRPNARWMGNLFTLDKIRQFDTAGGSAVWVDSLQPGTGGLGAGAVGEPAGPQVIGRRIYEDTAMAAALTTGTKILVIGDFSYFVIVDRVGMDVEVVPLVVGTNHRPTGQRGLYAYWRNSSDALSAAAFQVLLTG